MKLSVAANYDRGVIAHLRRLEVDEVFGKLPVDCVSGGRPSYMGGGISLRRLRSYVGQLAAEGMAFNYLLNGSCLGNREWTKAFHRQLDALLDCLLEMGVHRLTVSTPFLLEAIKARRQPFWIKVGVYANVNSPSRARFWADLGADCITLPSYAINRDFDMLAAIRQAVSCQLQLVANHCCLPNCPMQPYHANGFAHASDGSRNVFLDWCSFRCGRIRLQDDSLWIRSQWIRPQDVGAYEAIGIDSLKILERGMPSGAMVQRLEAYRSGQFKGNLARLLLPYGFGQAPRRGPLWLLRYFLRPRQVRPWSLRQVRELAKIQGMLYSQVGEPILIDSQALGDDFLEGFRSRHCGAADCSRCGYCQQIAREAVRVDENFRQKVIEHAMKLESAMAGGKFWGV